MLIRDSLLSERSSKREPAAIRIFSLACCLDHHDANATQLTDKIPKVRPRKHDDQVNSTAQFLDWFKRPFPNKGICQYYRQLALEAVQRRKPQPAPGAPIHFAGRVVNVLLMAANAAPARRGVRRL